MTASKIDLEPNELQLLLQLVGAARSEGLAEVEYKGIKLKFRPLRDPAAAAAGTPSVQGYAMSWSTELRSPDKE